MHYSYEFKKKCVELYRQGQYWPTPDGLSDEQFHATVRKWFRLEEANGPEILKHKTCNRVWSPEEKLNLVSQVVAGKSNKAIALENGISEGQLYQWVRKYKTFGYND